MRIAVTGASGFIGRHIANRFFETGHQVSAYGRRETPPALHPGVVYQRWDITERLKGPSVDIVVHAAAHVADWGPYDRFFQANVVGTLNVLEAFPSAGLFIQISSASVYGSADNGTGGLTEDQMAIGAQRSHYGLTKALAELEVTKSHRNTVILRPRAVYGEGDTNLLPRLMRANRMGHLLAVGNGSNEVSITHIDNLVHAVECCAGNNPEYSVYNIADLESVRMDELLKTIATAAGLVPRVVYVPRRFAMAMAYFGEGLWKLLRFPGQPVLTRYAVDQISSSRKLDISLALRELNYRPEHVYQEVVPWIEAWRRNGATH